MDGQWDFLGGPRGYPKIATVILNDLVKLAQLSFGKEVSFEKVSIETAENLYYENKNNLDEIFKSIKNYNN